MTCNRIRTTRHWRSYEFTIRSKAMHPRTGSMSADSQSTVTGRRISLATMHGHRHAYGRRLMRAGVDPVLRKKALHHKALASQAVYTVPNMAEVTRALSTAAGKLDELVLAGRAVKPPLDTSQLLAFGFED